MKTKMFSGQLASAFYLALLGISVPLFAEAPQAVEIHLSTVELEEIFKNPTRSYVYVGSEINSIAEVMQELSKLDENPNSLIHSLARHIENGFVIGHYDAVAQALEEAEALLQKSADVLGEEKAAALARSLGAIVADVIEEKFNLDADMLAFLKDQVEIADDVNKSCCSSGLRLLVIKEKLDVLGKAKFFNNVTFKDYVKFDHSAKFKHNIIVEGNAIIEGTISIGDEVITGNLDLPNSTSATVGNITKAGASFIQNFGTNNTFVGVDSGNFTLTSTNNSGFGVNTLGLLSTGGNNTAVGANALAADSTGGQNVAVGSGALQNLTSGIGVAVGFQALNADTTGTQNTALGWGTLAANTVGNFNTAVGFSGLLNNTTGVSNTAVGNNALLNNTTGSFNSAVGASALAANTTGIDNTAMGFHALVASTVGTDNTALGFNALASSSTGNFNTAVGSNALLNDTANNNTAVGYNTLSSNITGFQSVAVGANAMANQIGGFGVAVGFNALSSNTTATNGTAVGWSALAANTTGDFNTAIGHNSLSANTTGASNTALGYNVLSSNTTGVGNVGIGNSALLNSTIGIGNIALGRGAGSTLTSGNNNIYVGNNGVATETGAIRIGTLGTQATCFVQGISGVTTGLAAVAVLVDANGQLGTVSSSASVKDHIQDMGNASADIYKLRPVTFVYKNDETETVQYGLIAEEVAEAFPALAVPNRDGNGFYSVHYETLPVLVLHELQLLAARVAVLEARQ